MKRPRKEDYKRQSHDCWGKLEWDYDTSTYLRELEKYVDFLEKEKETMIENLNAVR